MLLPNREDLGESCRRKDGASLPSETAALWDNYITSSEVLSGE